MVLVVGSGLPKTRRRKRDPTLRHRQVGKLRLLVDRGPYLESV